MLATPLLCVTYTVTLGAYLPAAATLCCRGLCTSEHAASSTCTHFQNLGGLSPSVLQALANVRFLFSAKGLFSPPPSCCLVLTKLCSGHLSSQARRSALQSVAENLVNGQVHAFPGLIKQTRAEIFVAEIRQWTKSVPQLEISVRKIKLM